MTSERAARHSRVDLRHLAQLWGRGGVAGHRGGGNVDVVPVQPPRALIKTGSSPLTQSRAAPFLLKIIFFAPIMVDFVKMSRGVDAQRLS